MPITDYRLIRVCQQDCGIRPELFYQRTFQPKFPMQMHRHITVEFMCAESNAFMVEFLDESGKSKLIRIRQGEMIIINSLVQHRLILDENPARILNVEFRAVDLDPTIPYAVNLYVLYTKSTVFRNFVEEDWDYVIIGFDDSIRRLILDIQTYWERPQVMESTNTVDHTRSMLLQAITAQLLLRCGNAYYDGPRTTSSNYVNEAREYIQQNLDKELMIADISAQININPSYLETLFRKLTGLTIVEYINKQRVLKALTYLNSTDQSITDIGYLIGYNNRQHFTRMFKKIMGVSPGQYRKSLQAAEVKNYEDDNEPLVKNYYGE